MYDDWSLRTVRGRSCGRRSTSLPITTCVARANKIEGGTRGASRSHRRPDSESARKNHVRTTRCLAGDYLRPQMPDTATDPETHVHSLPLLRDREEVRNVVGP